MAAVGLPLYAFGERSPYRLSGGEQRRLSLASVLVLRPAMLVLDEPTFGQDRHGYEGLLRILDEHVDAGACVIAATHDERFVADTSTRVIAMADGRIARDEVVP
jgi:energy-coupling factor transport system ATP-binding protein